MEYLVKTRSKRTKKFIEAIMPSLLKQLSLENSRKALLIEISKSAGEGNDGMTVPLPGLDAYVISIKPGKWESIGLTLAHEMVHVKQLAKGILKADKGVKYWRGKRFSKRVKYLDTPWEQEAFAKQEILFRRAIGE